jgi:hypothetical protein
MRRESSPSRYSCCAQATSLVLLLLLLLLRLLTFQRTYPLLPLLLLQMFRGRDPTPDAILRHNGLVIATA